jgi:integrase
MLKAEKRHTKRCRFKEYDRAQTKCRCAYHALGMLNGTFVRESLRTSNYEEAIKKIRERELGGNPEPVPVTIEEAAKAFLNDIRAQQMNHSTTGKYRTLVKQLRAWSNDRGFQYVKQLDIESLTQFRASWKMGPRASGKKLEQLRRFCRFAVDRKWMEENPAAKIKMPTVKPTQKQPYTPEELKNIYAACLRYPGRAAEAPRVYAFVLLLRYTGLRISDAATFSTDKLDGNRALLHMKKTGEPVYTWLPDILIERLRVLPLVRDKYFFMGARGSERIESVTDTWRKKLNRVFEIAGPFTHKPHPHRFRHTFAVDLLQKGVPIEDVSTLLGHGSVKITERHYAAWVKGRQQRLENVLRDAWLQEPANLAPTEPDRVN